MVHCMPLQHNCSQNCHDLNTVINYKLGRAAQIILSDLQECKIYYGTPATKQSFNSLGQNAYCWQFNT